MMTNTPPPGSAICKTSAADESSFRIIHSSAPDAGEVGGFSFEAIAKPLRKWTGQSPSLPKCRSRVTFSQLWEGRASSRLGFATTSIDCWLFSQLHIFQVIPRSKTLPATSLAGSQFRVQRPERGMWTGSLPFSFFPQLLQNLPTISFLQPLNTLNIASFLKNRSVRSVYSVVLKSPLSTLRRQGVRLDPTERRTPNSKLRIGEKP